MRSMRSPFLSCVLRRGLNLSASAASPSTRVSTTRARWLSSLRTSTHSAGDNWRSSRLFNVGSDSNQLSGIVFSGVVSISHLDGVPELLCEHTRERRAQLLGGGAPGDR